MAAKPAFADTSFFCALAARRDTAHDLATRTLARMLKSGRRIVTTDFIVDETLTLVKIRTDARTALALLDRIEISDAIAMEPINAYRFQAARSLFRRLSDHAYSFTDCSSFVVMRELSLVDALTTDAHFVEAGYKALLRV